MGYPVMLCNRSCIRRLTCWLFWLSLLGLLTSLALTFWAYRLEEQLGRHLSIALPIEGHLLPGSLGLVVILSLPCHLLGLLLWPRLVRDLTRRRVSSRNPATGNRRSGCINRLLVLHALLACLSGWLAAGSCAGGAYYWDRTRRRVGQGLRKALRRYHDSETVKAQLDRMQVELACCGSESYRDWFFVPWVRSTLIDAAAADNDDEEEEKEIEDEDGDDDYRYLENDRETIQSQKSSDDEQGLIYLASVDVPYSCCLVQTLQTCVHDNLVDRNFGPVSIAIDGCREKLIALANEAGIDIAVCLILLTVYQITLSVLSRILQTARLSAKRTDIREKRLETWFFGTDPHQRSAPRPDQSREKDFLLSELDDLGSWHCTRGRMTRRPTDVMDKHINDTSNCWQNRTAARPCKKTKTRCNCNGNNSSSNNNKNQMCKGNAAPNSLSSSSSSSSSTYLPSLPPTPRCASRPKKVPTQYVVDGSCPLHNRCPVHQTPTTRFNCSVHGRNNTKR